MWGVSCLPACEKLMDTNDNAGKANHHHGEDVDHDDENKHAEGNANANANANANTNAMNAIPEKDVDNGRKSKDGCESSSARHSSAQLSVLQEDVGESRGKNESTGRRQRLQKMLRSISGRNVQTEKPAVAVKVEIEGTGEVSFSHKNILLESQPTALEIDMGDPSTRDETAVSKGKEDRAQKLLRVGNHFCICIFGVLAILVSSPSHIVSNMVGFSLAPVLGPATMIIVLQMHRRIGGPTRIRKGGIWTWLIPLVIALVHVLFLYLVLNNVHRYEIRTSGNSTHAFLKEGAAVAHECKLYKTSIAPSKVFYGTPSTLIKHIMAQHDVANDDATNDLLTVASDGLLPVFDAIMQKSAGSACKAWVIRYVVSSLITPCDSQCQPLKLCADKELCSMTGSRRELVTAKSFDV